MSDEQPEGTETEETEGTEDEGEAVAPPMATDPILGDQRTDVQVIGGGSLSDPQPESQPRPLNPTQRAEQQEAEAEEAGLEEGGETAGV